MDTHSLYKRLVLAVLTAALAVAVVGDILFIVFREWLSRFPASGF